MGSAICTIDVGTSSCKATFFSPAGLKLGCRSHGYNSACPKPGWVEQDPRDWWRAAKAAIREAFDLAGSPAVSTIVVTGQMHGVVAVDAAGHPLAPCPTVRDRRAQTEAYELARTLGLETVYRITGARLDPSSPMAKLLWWRRHRPEILDRARWLLAPKDYLRWVLTGLIVTEPIDAAGMQLYDLDRGVWSLPLIEAAGARPEQLPEIVPCSSQAGCLQPDPAKELGLPSGIPIIAGAGDDIEFLGAGLISPGMALEHVGTTGSLLICTDRPVRDPAMTLDIYPHVVPGHWLVGGSTSNAGGALAWAAHALNGGHPLTAPDPGRAGRSPPLLFLPYLSGERCPVWDPNAVGAFFGLDLSHTADDLLEAVHLGAAFSLRHICGSVATLGLDPETIISSASSESVVQWAQLRADVYGKPLRLLEVDDATATGAMLLGAVAIGHYPDLTSAVQAVVRERSAVQPNPSRSERYTRLFAAYLELYRTTRDIAGQLSLLRSPETDS